MENISVKNLSKSYGNRTVLHNLSLEFEAGKITCIMGKSGCGKTTLLNILMGLSHEDSGEITGLTKLIAPVFQEDRLCEDFSVGLNINLVRKTPVNINTLESHLNWVGLEDCINKPCKELSGGMKRRVAIVRSILSDNELIIMDEPFKGLDEITRAITAKYILNNRDDKTIIMVTHDPEEVDLMEGILIQMKDAD